MDGAITLLTYNIGNITSNDDWNEKRWNRIFAVIVEKKSRYCYFT